MADDNSVEITFAASTDEALAGIVEIRDALAGLTAPVAGLGGSLGRMGETFGAALPVDKLDQCKKGFSELGTATERAGGNSGKSGPRSDFCR